MARINPKTSRSEVTEAAMMHHNAKRQAIPVKATTNNWQRLGKCHQEVITDTQKPYIARASVLEIMD
jgi:hypothetical protein